VGLPELHVRRALAEVGTTPPPAGRLDRWFGPAVVAVHREVPGTPEELTRTLDDFLVTGQLLQPVRRSREYMLYRPAADWLSRFAHAASGTSRRYYWASAKSVEVLLLPVDDRRTRLELRVDPGIRGNNVGGALGGGITGGAGAGVGVGLLTGMALGAPVLVAVGAGVVFAGAVAGAAWVGTGRYHRRRMEEVKDELEGVLDRLEHEDTLEPPPASWRRWVQRQAKLLRVDLLGGGWDPGGRDR